ERVPPILDAVRAFRRVLLPRAQAAVEGIVAAAEALELKSPSSGRHQSVKSRGCGGRVPHPLFCFPLLNPHSGCPPFKAYLYRTKYLLTRGSREHLSRRRFLFRCNANPALFSFTVYGPTAHASASLSRLSRMKDLK